MSCHVPVFSFAGRVRGDGRPAPLRRPGQAAEQGPATAATPDPPARPGGDAGRPTRPDRLGRATPAGGPDGARSGQMSTMRHAQVCRAGLSRYPGLSDLSRFVGLSSWSPGDPRTRKNWTTFWSAYYCVF